VEEGHISGHHIKTNIEFLREAGIWRKMKERNRERKQKKQNSKGEYGHEKKKHGENTSMTVGGNENSNEQNSHYSEILKMEYPLNEKVISVVQT
jgi:hypothetical protein